MAGEMMAVDPEMELLEKQLQQSVDSLSTLLEKKEKGGGKREGAKVEKEGGEKEEGEEEGGESGSEGEDDQSEGDFLERRLSGGGPSLTDQMSLLSPGSLRLTARDLSPESALEDSTNSNTDPPLAGPQTPGGTTPDSAHPPFSSSSRRVVTSTSSSPGAPLLEERGARPRSHSCDSQRRSGLGSSPKDKPLMIPSSIPPWLEMVCLIYSVFWGLVKAFLFLFHTSSKHACSFYVFCVVVCAFCTYLGGGSGCCFSSLSIMPSIARML